LGWITSDTPVAKKASPSPGSVAAKSGRSSPCTAEVLTPPFSNTPPSVSTRVRPPPPPGRCQASLRNEATPSSAASASQMRDCSPSKYAWACAASSAMG
jgi:hypothetical protein